MDTASSRSNFTRSAGRLERKDRVVGRHCRRPGRGRRALPLSPLSVKSAIATYLSEVEGTKSPATHDAYPTLIVRYIAAFLSDIAD